MSKIQDSINGALKTYSGRSMVPASEFMDVLLDLQQIAAQEEDTDEEE